MGMSASQARFLGLTARKNNIEFEGQQINQQRTVLANQSANYYNDLLGMSVPIPPSVDDYTKTVYTFNDGALTNQITAMIAQSNGEYSVSFLRQWDDDFSIVSAATSVVARGEDDKYRVGADVLRLLSPLGGTSQTVGYKYNGQTLTFVRNDKFDDVDTENVEEYPGKVYKFGDGEKDHLYFISYPSGDRWYIDDPDSEDVIEITENLPEPITEEAPSGTIDTPPYNDATPEQKNQVLREEAAYLDLLQQKYGDGDYYVRYIQNTSTGEYEPYFYSKAQLDYADYDPETLCSLSAINCYTVGSETKTEEVKAVPGCKLEKDSTGRFINITIPQIVDGKPNTNAPAVTYSLTTSTVTDQDRYEDAMNQYEYDKYQYDQTIQDINSKIEIVQAQDKNLELRLKQLDTEQKAVSTEMESVANVIKSNVEKTFNVFS